MGRPRSEKPSTTDVALAAISPWSSTHISPHLRKLVRLIMGPDYKFYTEVDKVIIDVLLRHTSMTEQDLKVRTQLDNQTLKNGILRLVKDKLLKIRQSGDANGSSVGMGHIYVNFGDLRNHIRYKLNAIRRKTADEEKRFSSSNRWYRKETWFRCTAVICGGRVRSLLYASEVFHSETNTFRCNYCKLPLETFSVDDQEIVTSEQYNKTFEKMYKLIAKIDAYRPPAGVNSGSTPARVAHRNGLPIAVCIVDSMDTEEPTPKEMPPWFRRSNN